jgi:Bacterial Ig domain
MNLENFLEYKLHKYLQLQIEGEFMKVRLLTILLISIVLCYAKTNTPSREFIELPAKSSVTDDLEITVLGQGLTPEDMVDFLVGHNTHNVDISNIQYIGAEIASGIFTGASSEGLPINSGVILSSGFAENVYGPNISEGITGLNGVPGSAVLNSLIPGYSTNDASILGFDFTPKYNVVGFNYVFGSDEYLEWVGSSFNDVFGLFIDGQNIALIPGTNVTVAINSVNHESYSQYYVDNPVGAGHYNVEADGFTISISARFFILPGVSHHIEFAVADAGDYILDSWVFLEQGSFHSEPSIAFLDLIIIEGTELDTLEDEVLEIHAIAIGEDQANFVWTLHQPPNGYVEFISNDLIEEERTILYTPNEDYNGLDYFIVSVQDGLGGLVNRYIEIELEAVRDKPVCTELPYIYGDFIVDNEVNCYPGIWNDDKDNQFALPGQESIIFINYQWQYSISGIGFWVDIEDAVDQSFLIPEEIEDHYLRCMVIATDTGIGIGPEDTTIELTNVEYCSLQSGSDGVLLVQSEFLGVHPNPFNPITTFNFNLSESIQVNIDIYNIKGQLILKLLDETMSAGSKNIIWNGTDKQGVICPTGIYFSKIQLGRQLFKHKLMLLK